MHESWKQCILRIQKKAGLREIDEMAIEAFKVQDNTSDDFTLTKLILDFFNDVPSHMRLHSIVRVPQLRNYSFLAFRRVSNESSQCASPVDSMIRSSSIVPNWACSCEQDDKLHLRCKQKRETHLKSCRPNLLNVTFSVLFFRFYYACALKYRRLCSVCAHYYLTSLMNRILPSSSLQYFF